MRKICPSRHVDHIAKAPEYKMPTTLVSRRVRDPLVGRDLPVGTLVGVVSAALSQLETSLPYWINVSGIVSPETVVKSPLHSVESRVATRSESINLGNALSSPWVGRGPWQTHYGLRTSNSIS